MAADDEHLGVVPLDRLAEHVPSVPLHRLKHSVAHLRHTTPVRAQHKEHEIIRDKNKLISCCFFIIIFSFASIRAKCYHLQVAVVGVDSFDDVPVRRGLWLCR
jgi:hypothetical protein